MPNEMSDNKQAKKSVLVKGPEAAYIAGCHPATFRRWVKAGKMPQPVPLYGGRWWRRADIERAIAPADGQP